MNNTIFYTPTNEQILEIAKEHPELHNQIKESLVEELKSSAVKYAQKSLQAKTNYIFESLSKDVQKKYFISLGYSDYKFTATVEEQFTKKLEEHLDEQLQKEFEEYIQRPEFVNSLKYKIKERMLSLVMSELDKQIVAESKKLLA